MGSFLSKHLTEEEMVKVQELVENLIKDNKIVVFSKTYCPYCTKAKAILKELGVEFHVIELDQEDDGAAIQDYLLTKTGQRTVPNIFINEKHIGGCDDLKKVYNSGELAKLVK